MSYTTSQLNRSDSPVCKGLSRVKKVIKRPSKTKLALMKTDHADSESGRSAKILRETASSIIMDKGYLAITRLLIVSADALRLRPWPLQQ